MSAANGNVRADITSAPGMEWMRLAFVLCLLTEILCARQPRSEVCCLSSPAVAQIDALQTTQILLCHTMLSLGNLTIPKKQVSAS